MRTTFASALVHLGFLAQTTLAQQNSQHFSKFAGAPTVTAEFEGPSASALSNDLKICTNFLHGLPPVDTLPVTSMIPQLEQQQADGVCQFCTSVKISRVDSCCAQPSSVACFNQFAAAAATTTGSGNLPANTKSSTGGKVNAVSSGRSLWRVDANNR